MFTGTASTCLYKMPKRRQVPCQPADLHAAKGWKRKVPFAATGPCEVGGWDGSLHGDCCVGCFDVRLDPIANVDLVWSPYYGMPDTECVYSV